MLILNVILMLATGASAKPPIVPAKTLQDLNQRAVRLADKAKAACQGKHFFLRPSREGRSDGKARSLGDSSLRENINQTRFNDGAKFCAAMEEELYQGFSDWQGKGFAGENEWDSAIESAMKARGPGRFEPRGKTAATYKQDPTRSAHGASCLTQMAYSYDPKGELVVKLSTTRVGEDIQDEGEPVVLAEFRVPRDDKFFLGIFPSGKQGLKNESRECLKREPLNDLSNCRWASGEGCSGEVVCDGASNQGKTVARVHSQVDCARLMQPSNQDRASACRAMDATALRGCIRDSDQVNFRVKYGTQAPVTVPTLGGARH